MAAGKLTERALRSGQLVEPSSPLVATGKKGACLPNGHPSSVTHSDGTRPAGRSPFNLLTLRSPDGSFEPRPFSYFVEVGGVSRAMEMLAHTGGQLEPGEGGKGMSLVYHDGTRLTVTGDDFTLTQRRGSGSVITARMYDPV